MRACIHTVDVHVRRSVGTVYMSGELERSTYMARSCRYGSLADSCGLKARSSASLRWAADWTRRGRVQGRTSRCLCLIWLLCAVSLSLTSGRMFCGDGVMEYAESCGFGVGIIYCYM
jgi:hypothetical protein